MASQRACVPMVCKTSNMDLDKKEANDTRPGRSRGLVQLRERKTIEAESPCSLQGRVWDLAPGRRATLGVDGSILNLLFC
jgi:hypothetical protein